MKQWLLVIRVPRKKQKGILYLTSTSSIWQQGEKLFDKLSTVVTSKAAVMKEKLTNYIKNEQPPMDR